MDPNVLLRFSRSHRNNSDDDNDDNDSNSFKFLHKLGLMDFHIQNCDGNA